jgi:Zn-dependent protease
LLDEEATVAWGVAADRGVIRFRVGPVPVAVFPSFLFGALIVGVCLCAGEPWRAFTWATVAFVGVLVHEMGHAMAGLMFGALPEIHLAGLGGSTFVDTPRETSLFRRISLALAGPVSSAAFGAAVIGAVHALRLSPDSPVEWTLQQLGLTSFLWAGCNLVPMLPLDGGQVLLAGIESARRRTAVGLVSVISAVVGLAVAVLCWTWFEQRVLAALCVVLALRSMAFLLTLARRPSGMECCAGPERLGLSGGLEVVPAEAPGH